MSSKPVDFEQRERARTDLDHNFVVAAGAGTGKTTLLTDRILNLLLVKKYRVQDIVALTFTEKAAGEIRERVTQKLIALLEGGHPERGTVETALEEMDRAQIATIHAFASHILKLYPLEAGVDPAFEVDDGKALDALFDAQWALWLEEELGEEPADRQAAKKWALRRERWLELLRLLRLEDLEELARTLCEEEVTAAKTVGTTDSIRISLAGLADEAGALAKGKPPKDGKGGRYGIEDEFARVSKALQAASKPVDEKRALPEHLTALAQGKSLTRKSWPSKWGDLEPRQIDEEIAVYNRAKDAARKISPERERLLAKSRELLDPVVRRVRRLYTQRGNIGYYGLLAKARALVAGDAAVREALKGRFKAILIDEFQDTDPAQGELLLFLGERLGQSAKTREQLRFEPGKLFVVGDPKQSIYRFRGAEIRAYEVYREQLLREGAVAVSLTANFRSHAGVLDPINAVFAEIMRAEPGLQPPYEAITPRPASAGAPREKGLELVGVTNEERALSSAESRAVEALWIARWIAVNCGEGKKFRFGDCALLLRTATSLAAYLEPLKNAGIPYVVEAERFFYDTQEVVDFLNFLRVLDDPSDRIAMTGLLRSPLVCLDDEELYRLAGLKQTSFLDAGKLPRAGLSPGSADRLTRFFALLRKLHQAAGRVPLGELVGRILSESFLLELCCEAYQRDQTASNLMKFGRMAAEAGDAGATLKEFIALISETMREGAAEGESPLADETLDAVRVLTVHKSKGLEFPVVFVPNMAGGVGGGAKPSLYKVDWIAGTVGLRLKKRNVCDAAMAMIEADESLRAQKESLRLLYVAMTRAREHLLLLGNMSKWDPRSFAALLQEGEFWDRQSVSMVDSGEKIVVPSIKSASAPPRLDPAALGALWEVRERKCREAEARAPFVSPSSLGGEHEKRPLPEGGEDEAAAAREFAAAAGVVCHRVLEWWDFTGEKGLSGEPYAELLERAVAEFLRAEPGADEGRLRAEAGGILESFLRSPAALELGRCRILARELPFVCPYEDGRVLRGIIDLLYRDPKGRLVVGDYKSAFGTDPAPYREQGGAYAAAVEHAIGETPEFRVIFLRAGKAVAA